MKLIFDQNGQPKTNMRSLSRYYFYNIRITVVMRNLRVHNKCGKTLLVLIYVLRLSHKPLVY